MSLSAGLVFLLQAVVLPGLLLTHRARFQSLVSRILAVAATSLLANYVLVTLLVALDQHRASTWKLVVGLELVGIAYLAWKRRDDRDEPGAPQAPWSAGMVAGFTACLLLLGIHAWMWSAELGRVFWIHDAIASWNRWALDWSNNQWPRQTWNYPQLLPTNWSISYVLTKGREGELFARALMGVFPSLILVGFTALVLRLRKGWLAAGAGAALLLIHVTQTINVFDGMADVPTATLGFIGGIFLILAREDRTRAGQWLLLAAVGFSAASISKQSGQMMAGFAVIWVLLDSRLREAARSDRKKSWMAAALLVLAVGHLHLSRVFIDLNSDTKLVQMLVHDIHEGRTFPQRIAHAVAMVTYSLKPAWPFSFVMLFLFLGSLFQPLGRRIFLHFVLPAFGIWALFFSYDIRNLAVAMPFAALAAGLGAEQWSEWSGAAWRHWSWLAKGSRGKLLVAAITCVLVLVPSLWISSGHLSALYRAAQRKAGDAELNRAVFNAMREVPGTILTSNLPLTIQPGTGKRTVYHHVPLEDDAELPSRLSQHRWLVVERHLSPAHECARQRLLGEGRLKELTQTEGWVLYEVSTPAKP